MQGVVPACKVQSCVMFKGRRYSKICFNKKNEMDFDVSFHTKTLSGVFSF